LVDIESRRYLGRPLSELNYICYNHGPFDSDILDQLDKMESAGLLDVERYNCCGNIGYNYSSKKNGEDPFCREEEAILNHVTEVVRKCSLKNLLEDVVHQTEPMLDAARREAFGRRLRMELVDNQKRLHGLELERVLKAIEGLDKGQGQPSEEFFAEVRV
jgi:hypothetical protein